MTADRLFQRVDSFRQALSRLREALALPESDVVRDATIQRFEFTYELAWKSVKLFLETRQIFPQTPKDTLREALQWGIIQDGNGWSLLHEYRNQTSHTYDEQSAIDIFNHIRTEGIILLGQLEAHFIMHLKLS